MHTPQPLGKDGSRMKSGRQEKAGKAGDALSCAARPRSPAHGAPHLPRLAGMGPHQCIRAEVSNQLRLHFKNRTTDLQLSD